MPLLLLLLLLIRAVYARVVYILFYRDGPTLHVVQGRVCRPLFVVENNRLRIRKKHINDLHDPNYGWTNLMQQVGWWLIGWVGGDSTGSLKGKTLS